MNNDQSIGVCIIGGQEIIDVPIIYAPTATILIEITNTSVKTVCTYENISKIIIVPHPDAPTVQSIIDHIATSEIYGMISIKTSPVNYHIDFLICRKEALF